MIFYGVDLGGGEIAERVWRESGLNRNSDKSLEAQVLDFFLLEEFERRFGEMYDDRKALHIMGMAEIGRLFSKAKGVRLRFVPDEVQP